MLAGQAMADGKFYSDRIPPGIPYQRAILMFDGKKETLTLESKFEAKEGERFGWVVPVPTVPTLDSPDPSIMDLRYSVLEGRTRARVFTSFDLTLAAIGLLLLAYVVHCVRKKRWGTAVGVVVFVGALVLVASPSYMGVEVVREQRAGPYETKVIRGTSSTEIVAWLKENGFRLDERDRVAFDGYVSRGWVFVTAKLDAGAKGARGLMVPPLTLTFATRDAVYPLALTATAGETVEILLYVTAPYRVDAGGALPLLYAGRDATSVLSKFRGQLTPGQMRSDLVLRRAESDASYRAWEFRW